MKNVNLVPSLCLSLTTAIFLFLPSNLFANGYSLAQVPEQMEGEWLLEDLGGTGVIDNLQTTLQFGSENRLEGFGGCNRYFASYQLEQNQLKVGAIGATRKACLPAIMNQETRYLQALAKAYHIHLDRNQGLLLIDCQGLDKPLKFTRLTTT